MHDRVVSFDNDNRRRALEVWFVLVNGLLTEKHTPAIVFCCLVME